MFTSIKNYYQALMPELSQHYWDIIEKKFTIREIKKGEFISKPGDIVNHVNFINTGAVRMYSLVDGREFNANFFFENEYISDYESFLTRKPSRIYVAAMEDTQTIDLDYENMQSLYTEYPNFQKVGRLIAEDLFIYISQRSASLLMDSPEDKYLQLVKNNSQILQRVPQYMIASYLGITPEALSRIRSRLAKKV